MVWYFAKLFIPKRWLAFIHRIKKFRTPNFLLFVRLGGFGVAHTADTVHGTTPQLTEYSRRGHNHVKKSCPRWCLNLQPPDGGAYALPAEATAAAS